MKFGGAVMKFPSTDITDGRPPVTCEIAEEMSGDEFYEKYIKSLEEAFIRDDPGNDELIEWAKRHRRCCCFDGSCLWCFVKNDPDRHCNLGSREIKFILGRIILWNMIWNHRVAGRDAGMDRWDTIT